VRAASIMTLEPCRVYVIPQADVERMLEKHPAFARDLMHKLIGKVRSLTGRVADLAFKDVYARLVKFINENAVEQDGRRVIRERLTQHEIAARIGGSREMVSRILRDLTDGGYISVEGKHIVLLRKLPPNW
jgi:CRP/FNR family cyclic AMP-dependent transcriptional regulator